jgi:hypothetical protein
VKEEGEMSAINQACDQFMSKSDKRHIREMLDTTHVTLGMINQWELIGIYIKALKGVKPSSWINSFKKVGAVFYFNCNLLFACKLLTLFFFN